jgi:SAM-dependent methyltransferase
MLSRPVASCNQFSPHPDNTHPRPRSQIVPNALPGISAPGSAVWRPARDVWKSYFQLTQHQGPRRLLLEALDHVGPAAMQPGMGVDLGAGTGAAARLLYERTRWEVLAIDASPTADEYLCRRFQAGCPVGIRFQQASFQTVHLPPGEVNLLWAGLALPYMPQDQVAVVWQKISDALQPGGLFAGDFFGPQHGHVGREDMNFHHPSQIESLLRFMDVIKLERIIQTQPFSQGRPLMMDCYLVIARKPASA